VFVTGVGAMQFTSGYFYFVARMALSNLIFADPIEGGNFDDLCEMGPDDVLFCTAFSPCATASVRTVEFALSRGVPIVALTDSPVSPIARAATATLLVPTDSPQFFPSQSCVIAILETLIALLVANGGNKTIERIEEIINFRNEQGLYWQTRQEK
jgi:DNA-binding MurR/RpiR family transcriptional regulator